jgi:hypothetical protein
MPQVAEGIYSGVITRTAVADHKDGHKKILAHVRLETGDEVVSTLWIHTSGALARTKSFLKAMDYKETGLTPIAISENTLIGKECVVTVKPGNNPQYMNYDLSAPRKQQATVTDRAELSKFDNLFSDTPKSEDDDLPWNSN